MSRLLKVIFFILVVCLLGYLFQYIFEKKIILGSESAAAFKINRILYSNDKNEIPIFGASTAQGGLIPHILGPDFFNYGIDGVRDEVLLFFMNEECKKEKVNPSMVLVLFLEGFKHSIGDPNNYILNSGNPDVRRLLGDEYRFYYKIPFIKYYGQYDSYLKDYLNERMQLTKYKDRGASIEKNAPTPEKFQSLVEERKNTVEGFSNDSSIASRFIAVVKNNPQRRFIILIPPVHSSFFYRYANYQDALDYFSYLASFPNIHVLNYSQHYYPDDCYINTTHLNYKGAVQFSNLIKDTLQKLITK